MMKSNAKQRQKIGHLRKLLGMDDEIYYETVSLYGNGAKSSKDLTVQQANELLNKLRDMAKDMGLFNPKKSTKFKQYKYNTLGKRENRATPKQLRMIEAMWMDRSYIKDEPARAKALNTFIKRITGKDNILFMTPHDVSKTVKAMENMIKRQPVR